MGLTELGLRPRICAPREGAFSSKPSDRLKPPPAASPPRECLRPLRRASHQPDCGEVPAVRSFEVAACMGFGETDVHQWPFTPPEADIRWLLVQPRSLPASVAMCTSRLDKG